MGGFVIGQVVLLMVMMVLILCNFLLDCFIFFEFYECKKFYFLFMVIGLFYNIVIWIDKVMFWYMFEISQVIIGLLCVLVIYDLLVFLVYFLIILGMVIFLLCMEIDFVEDYDVFYEVVCIGVLLEIIEKYCNGMVEMVCLGLLEIIKIQVIIILLLMVMGEFILKWLGIFMFYLLLFYIDVIVVSLQVVLLGIFNVFFYFDKCCIVLGLCGGLVVFNFVFIVFLLYLGLIFYGFGFVLVVFVVVLVGFVLFICKLELLEYEIFML